MSNYSYWETLIWAEDDARPRDPDRETIGMWWKKKFSRDFEADYKAAQKTDLGDGESATLSPQEGIAVEVVLSPEGWHVHSLTPLTPREKLWWRGVKVISADDELKFKEWFEQLKRMEYEIQSLANIVQNPIFVDWDRFLEWSKSTQRVQSELTDVLNQIKSWHMANLDKE